MREICGGESGPVSLKWFLLCFCNFKIYGVKKSKRKNKKASNIQIKLGIRKRNLTLIIGSSGVFTKV